jgi:hypothetical protein
VLKNTLIAMALILGVIFTFPVNAIAKTVEFETELFLDSGSALEATKAIALNGRTAYIDKRHVGQRDIFIVIEFLLDSTSESPTPAKLPDDNPSGLVIVATLSDKWAANKAIRLMDREGIKAFVIETVNGDIHGYSIVLDPTTAREKILTIASPFGPPKQAGAKGVSQERKAGVIAKTKSGKEATAATRGEPKNKPQKTMQFEYELNPYYSNVNLFLSLTNAPIPDAGEKSEMEIYKEMLLSSYIPRFLVLEVSINPMPLAGVELKKRATDMYEMGDVTDDLNFWQVITEGFEEPWALSIFLGNVMNFKRAGRPEMEGGNKGFMGYLLSVGNFHIKDNELIADNWQELEWKVKGDRDYPKHNLSWSFRIGGKFHENPDITDVYHIALRRSRLDLEPKTTSLLNNAAFEYTYTFDQSEFKPVGHKFFLEKKFPQKGKNYAFTLGAGFIYDLDRKYTGSLDDRDGESFALMIRPNIEF